MGNTLDGLIEKIKQEGVREAKKISSQMIDDAKKEAKQIIEDAKKEASDIISRAKEEAEAFRKTADNAIEKAARDTVLTVKEKIINICESLLKKKVAETLRDEFLKDIILKVVDNWSQKEDRLNILLSKDDAEKIKSFILAKVKEAAKSKISISVDESIETGFRIGIEGENVYYDFSEESITEALKVFLSPRIREILDKDG